MKKDGKFSQFIILILVIPIAVLTALALIIYTPACFIRYCFSARRKKMKRKYPKQAKYTWLITLTHHFKLFELISKHNLPIEFYPKNPNPCKDGYFYSDKILFLPDVVPHFDPEKNHWFIVHGHDESDLLYYMEAEKEDFHKRVGFDKGIKCEKIVFLVEEKDVCKEEKDIFNATDFILTYNKKNFVKKINELLSK